MLRRCVRTDLLRIACLAERALVAVLRYIDRYVSVFVVDGSTQANRRSPVVVDRQAMFKVNEHEAAERLHASYARR